MFLGICWLLVGTLKADSVPSAQLYDELLSDYNNHRRPAISPNVPTKVLVRLSLSQIIELDEIGQAMTCSMWLRQSWKDPRLEWNPLDYGGVDVIHIPHEAIWTPDLLLYNAESGYNITISTRATVFSSGRVFWEPPAVFRSTCQIDVRWFPFDDQKCSLKFGSWSYPQTLVNLELIDNVGVGVDVSDYYPSVEWDIMSLKASRNVRSYRGCCSPEEFFVDLTFELDLRRKALFHTLNLLIPIGSMAFLTLLVFYLPADSGEKIQLCISILVSVTFFVLLLTELLPASGTSLPLVGQFLLFSILMISASTFVAAFVLNIHFRKPTTHSMSDWTRRFLLHRLPLFLGMKVPKLTKRDFSNSEFGRILRREMSTMPPDYRLRTIFYSPKLLKAIENVEFIAQFLRQNKAEGQAEEEWRLAAAVLDRLFLWIFGSICLLGSVTIFGQAPLFYDGREPLDLISSRKVHSLQQIINDSFNNEQT